MKKSDFAFCFSKAVDTRGTLKWGFKQKKGQMEKKLWKHLNSEHGSTFLVPGFLELNLH